MKKIKIETSLGILEIPIDAFDENNIIYNLYNSLDSKDISYLRTLRKLYSFTHIQLKDNWIIIHLSDPYYGNPEYKILPEQEVQPKKISSKTGKLYQYMPTNYTGFSFPRTGKGYYENEIYDNISIAEMVQKNPEDWKEL